jgi:hypothetical protein
MIEQLDKRIAALETELAELRHRKIALLQAQIAAVEASLAGESSAFSPKASVSYAKTRAGKPGPKKRGRRAGPRVPDEQVLPSITKLVSASGKEGISARKVSDATGHFYPRVLKLMEMHFKKTGERKWSRYHLK